VAACATDVCCSCHQLTASCVLHPAEEEEQELAKLRKLLCLTKEAVADIDTATKGRIFRTAVQSALGAGIDNFTQVAPTPMLLPMRSMLQWRCLVVLSCALRDSPGDMAGLPDCRRTARLCGKRARQCGCLRTWPSRSSRTPPASALLQLLHYFSYGLSRELCWWVASHPQPSRLSLPA
jgi:Chloroplast envelope transporter